MTAPRPSQSRPRVKAAFTPRRSYRETPDVQEAVVRLVRALGKRIATEDADSLPLLVELGAEVDRALAFAVNGVRSSGATDEMIGEALGVTKQAVGQRWRRAGRPR